VTRSLCSATYVFGPTIGCRLNQLRAESLEMSLNGISCGTLTIANRLNCNTPWMALFMYALTSLVNLDDSPADLADWSTHHVE
jgi:hypothetical protein